MKRIIVFSTIVILLGPILVKLSNFAIAQATVVGYIDAPAPDSTVSPPLRVIGWAADTAAGFQKGPGIDLIRLYQGETCDGNVLGADVPHLMRTDVSETLRLDSSYAYSGFRIVAPGTLSGRITFTVCAHGI